MKLESIKILISEMNASNNICPVMTLSLDYLYNENGTTTYGAQMCQTNQCMGWYSSPDPAAPGFGCCTYLEKSNG